MKERACAGPLRRQNRRRACEASHCQGGLWGALFEQPRRRTVGLDESANESEFAAVFQTDRRQCDDLHAEKAFHGLLIHFLWRDEQHWLATALHKLIGHRQSGKEMPARPTAGDGDTERWFVLGGHVCGCARRANGFTTSPSFARVRMPSSLSRACRAMLSRRPTLASMASKFEPP